LLVIALGSLVKHFISIRVKITLVQIIKKTRLRVEVREKMNLEVAMR
jgi:hypothetical protein